MHDISIWSLIVSASLPVQLVMLVLLGMSVFIWTIIIYKHFILSYHRKILINFEEYFWQGNNMQALYNKLIANSNDNIEGILKIFCAGFKSFVSLSSADQQHINILNHSMESAIIQEGNYLNKHLTALASCGSVSPYVGLFGTVWGIMNAFLGIAVSGNADLTTTAPGIAEALIATAMGILVAIPSVVAYNHYCTATDKLVNNYQEFAQEFSSILYKRLPSTAS